MKQLLIIIVCCVMMTEAIHAQDFITHGKIEFEIKRNNRRSFNDLNPGNDYADAIPEFDISYRDLDFAGNQLLYSPARRGTSKTSLDEKSLYTNLDTRQTISKQYFLGDPSLLEDSVRPIKWKIENEVRKIAGFECRKAIGRYHDSVYVVAFYCPEIIPQGGPEFFTGLPGMILGLAVPQLYTTWFATRIELVTQDASKIVPPTMKKGTQIYKKKEMADLIYKKYKDSGWWSDLTPERAFNYLDMYTL